MPGAISVIHTVFPTPSPESEVTLGGFLQTQIPGLLPGFAKSERAGPGTGIFTSSSGDPWDPLGQGRKLQLSGRPGKPPIISSGQETASG